MASLMYWLWLSSAGLSPRAKAALLERYGDAETAFHAPEGDFETLRGLSRAEASVLERRDLSLAGEVYEACTKQGLKVLSLQDADYPGSLRHIFSPPVVLYVKGELPPPGLGVPIALIGTRRCSDYGLRMSRELAAGITRCGGTVVSLLTSGIEQAAAEAALEAGGRCIGVLGTAHELETRRLAAAVAERGALLSEYPPFTRTIGSFFRDRNRIASGLSAGVVVVEAPEKSGTQLFVEEAAEQGKEIFAVPGNADAENSAGTLRMIREGARLVTTGWEVMSEFEALYPGTVRRAPEQPISDEAKSRAEARERRKETHAEKTASGSDPLFSEKPPESSYADLSKQLADLSEHQLKIVAAIDRDEKHIDDIIEDSGLPAAVVLAQMTFLELKGYIRRAPGRRFSLKKAKR